MTTPLDESHLTDNWLALRWLLHALQGAIRGRVLLLALIGVLVAELGVGALSYFAPSVKPLTISGTQPDGTSATSLSPADILGAGWQDGVWYCGLLAKPFRDLLSDGPAPVLGLLVGVWRVMVWSLLGVAICRVVSRHLTHHELPSGADALGLSLRHWAAQLASPLVLLAVTGALLAVLWCLGGLASWAPLGLMAAIGWPVIFIVAAVAAVIGLVFAVGSPLLLASFAVERPDPFDAVSSAFAYTTQRPLRLIAYLCQAALVGAIAGAVLQFALRLTMRVVTVWFAGLGELDSAGLGQLNREIIEWWITIIGQAPVVFHAAYFWSAAAAIYLLMRREIDEKQVDEIYLEESPSALSGSQSVGD